MTRCWSSSLWGSLPSCEVLFAIVEFISHGWRINIIINNELYKSSCLRDSLLLPCLIKLMGEEFRADIL